MKLRIENLNKSYFDKEVLRNINYEFESNKIYGLLGRNGSGKTTLFNCINEDIDINSGKFYLDEQPLKINDIGYVLSTPEVPEFLTAQEFLKFFLEINKVENQKTLDEYFDMIRIEKDDRNKLLKEYSHGMKNKMQMLVNIIGNYKILLLDEPLTSFDVVVAEEMKNLLKSIKTDHIIIFSTHLMDLAIDLCDEIVLLNDKELTNVEKNREVIVSKLRGEENVQLI